jgi:hypothetical protein
LVRLCLPRGGGGSVMARRKPRRPRVRNCRFWADSEIPPDHNGKRRCRRCGVMGKPGDQHHPSDFDLEDLPETPLEDVTDRILGEA